MKAYTKPALNSYYSLTNRILKKPKPNMRKAISTSSITTLLVATS